MITYTEMDYGIRRSKIANKLKRIGIDSLLTLYSPNIKYICPFRGDKGALLICKDTSFLMVDSRYITEAKDEVREVEIREIKGSFLKTLKKVVEKTGIRSIAVEEEYLSYGLFRRIKEKMKGIRIHPASGWIEELRMVKDEEEIQCIKRACEIADRTFKELRNILKWGMSEKELADELEYRLKKESSEELPFPLIVAGGKRASYPHARPTNEPLKKGELIIIDFGAKYKEYCSDLTRTLSENIMDEKRKLYNLVLKVQEKVIERVKPGIRVSSLAKIARDIFQKEGVLRYFSHGLGHGVGLEVHEKPLLSIKKSLKLKKGMVFTIEPGLYIPEAYGVRIEDMVLVTSSGCELLTSSPK